MLAAIADFYIRRGVDTPDLPQAAPRALDTRDITRRGLALLSFYAGLRLGEVGALNTDDIRLSACKGLIIVRMGKGGKYREIPRAPPTSPRPRAVDQRRAARWKGAAATTALLLNHHGGRLGARGADDILSAIADHALRCIFREGHDIVIAADPLGRKRLDQTRRHSLPTQADREEAGSRRPVSVATTG